MLMDLERVRTRREHFERLLNDFIVFQQNGLVEKAGISTFYPPIQRSKNTMLLKSRILSELHQQNNVQKQVESCTDIDETNLDDSARLNMTVPKLPQDVQDTIRSISQSQVQKQMQDIQKSIQQRDKQIQRSLAKIRNDAAAPAARAAADKMTVDELQTNESSDSDVDKIIRKSVVRQLEREQNEHIIAKSLSREVQTVRPSYVSAMKAADSPIRRYKQMVPVEPYEQSRSQLSEQSQSYLRWMKGE